MKSPTLLALIAADLSPGKNPDVLFLFTDDQRAATIAALSDPTIHPPKLDRLVKHGVTIDHALWSPPAE